MDLIQLSSISDIFRCDCPQWIECGQIQCHPRVPEPTCHLQREDPRLCQGTFLWVNLFRFVLFSLFAYKCTLFISFIIMLHKNISLFNTFCAYFSRNVKHQFSVGIQCGIVNCTS